MAEVELDIAGGEAGVVAAALRDLGYGNAFCTPVSALACPEPVVVTAGDFARESRQADGTARGHRELTVTVACGDPHDAEATCLGACIDLERTDWRASRHPAGLRPVALDVGIPRAAGRDGSGRWLWELTCVMTSVYGEAR